MTFEIFELGLIAVEIEHFNFRAGPYCCANRTFKFLILAILRCKSKFLICELGLIAVHQCRTLHSLRRFHEDEIEIFKFDR